MTRTILGIAARVVPVLAVLGAILGAFGAGVDVSERPGVPVASIGVQLYYAIGLFFLGGLDLGLPRGGPEAARAVLWACYFLGPAITTTAVAEGALRLANPQWLGRVHRDHVVVVGRGRIADLVDEVVRRSASRARVLRAEPRALTRDEGRALGLSRASLVVLAGVDDLENLGVAWEVRAAHAGPRVIAHVGELSLRRGSTELAQQAGIELFNAHEISAAEIFATTLGPHFRATERRDLVAIVGFGRFGQTVLFHLQQQARGQVERVIVVDREATRISRQYREQVPLDPDCRFDAVDADARDPSAWDRLAAMLGESDVVPVVVLSTDDAATNLQAATGMRARAPEARFFVRCHADNAFLDEVERRHGVEGIAVERILRQALKGWLELG